MRYTFSPEGTGITVERPWDFCLSDEDAQKAIDKVLKRPAENPNPSGSNQYAKK